MNCNLIERVADALFPVVPEDSGIVVGLSGGLDSVVLLHLLHAIAPRFSWKLSAQHVHHGISANADTWANFCTTLCSDWGIPLKVERINITPLRAEHGIEAAARKLRYATFAKSNAEFIALAHHIDDQVETLCLQLLRGAGVRGAAAMPLLKLADHTLPSVLRPLLDIQRSELLEYAEQNSLQWIEDESNADERYSRNFLRHQILPLLEQKFPAYRQTLARSTSHFAEASELLDDLAAIDASCAVVADHLNLGAINALSTSRAKNLLRHFIGLQHAPCPDATRLHEMLRQLKNVRADAQISIAWCGWALHCYRGKIYVIKEISLPVAFEAKWSGERSIELPQLHGALHFELLTGSGLSLEKIHPHGILIRTRQGGETIQVQMGGHHRTLKNIFQEKNIPPWQRNLIPFLFCDDSLICVPGVASAGNFQAKVNEQGLLVSWQKFHYDA
ncbi:MAG: tRNA lysidine(34) synthetase TilS [Gallionellaceae bacterium]|nr:tRNA lysidine(34) synthetase TilS [Gallionellaceae bacterium]